MLSLSLEMIYNYAIDRNVGLYRIAKEMMIAIAKTMLS